MDDVKKVDPLTVDPQATGGRVALHAPSVNPATLKAFAHPLRTQMYQWLKDHGPGTASMLAEAMGESTGQTSYHLRQLEKHGLVAEDTSRGTARERWWDAQGFSFGLDTVDADPEVLTTVELLMRQGVERRRERQLEWIERQAREEREWQEVVTFSESTTRLTPAELKDLAEAVFAVMGEHLDRAERQRTVDGGEGARMVKMYAQYFPLPPD